MLKIGIANFQQEQQKLVNEYETLKVGMSNWS